MGLLNRAQEIFGDKTFKGKVTIEGDLILKRHSTMYSPVASQPSSGERKEKFVVLTTTVPGDDNVHTLDCSAYVPVGTKWVGGWMQISSALQGRELQVYDITGTNIYDKVRTQTATASAVAAGHWEAPLDSSRLLRYAVGGNATITGMTLDMTFYEI